MFNPLRGNAVIVFDFIRTTIFFNGYLFPLHPYLPFFSEIRQAEACGGLIFALGTHARDDEHDDRDDIGDHLVQFLDGEVRAARQEDVQDVQAAEEE